MPGRQRRREKACAPPAMECQVAIFDSIIRSIHENQIGRNRPQSTESTEEAHLLRSLPPTSRQHIRVVGFGCGPLFSRATATADDAQDQDCPCPCTVHPHPVTSLSYILHVGKRQTQTPRSSQGS
jgi:hypothetical protein